MKHTETISVSFHSIEKSEQRFGLHGGRRNYRQIVTDVRAASTINAFCGRQYAYLKEKTDMGCTPMVVGRKCYIVSPEQCVITVYHLPEWFSAHPLRSGKETARRARRYMRSRDLYACEAV